LRSDALAAVRRATGSHVGLADLPKKSDSLADAMGYVTGPKQEPGRLPHREYSNPDAEAAAEEADIAFWE
jgi:hypothetical protein